MTTRIEPPNQYEIEEELRALFKELERFGSITKVANWLRRDRSELSRQLNPEEPARSDVFDFVDFLYGCQAHDPELEESVWAIVERCRARYKEKTSRVDFPADAVFVAFKASLIDALPFKERLPFIRKAIVELERCERGLMSLDAEDGQEEAPRPKVVNG